jgi:hypothetical protein
MAKELPYFQFEPAAYLTKDVSFCSLAAQGLFTNICAYYWQRECKLTKQQFLRRLNHINEFNELIDEGVIDLVEEVIIIKFLDLQYEKATKTSKTNSTNGSKGGRPKKINPIKTENKPTALIPLSETKGIREDKRIEDKKIGEKKIEEEFNIDRFYDVNKLNEIYLENDRVVSSIMESQKISKEVLVSRLKEFTDNLISSGRVQESFREYAKYFLNWNRTSRKKQTTFKATKKNKGYV